MIFYPDQYFYQTQKPRRQASQRQVSTHPSSSRRSSSGQFENFRIPWEREFFEQQNPQNDWPFSQASVQQRRNSNVPDEYIVVDEEELAALRAYREYRRRQQKESQRREALIARRRAEEERRVKEAARLQAEARMRAQVEANARAAARQYVRQKQAQQIALQQAQYAERQQRQQLILEQLRKQFGFFNINNNGEAEEDEDGQTQQQQEANSQDARPVTENENAPGESVEDASHEEGGDKDQPAQKDREAKSSSSQQFDPIRTLLEALAPFPIVFTTESSDEEDVKKADAEENGNQHVDNDDEEDEDEYGEEVKPSKSTNYYQSESDNEGPTCETASEDSEPPFVEFIDPLARPPVFGESISGGEDDEEGGAEDDEVLSRKDRSKLRQTKDPKSRHKKQKHGGNRKKQPQPRQQPQQNAPDLETDAETVGLLHALEEDLSRINDGYNRIANLPAPTDIKEAVSRVEGVRIGFARSEEIYDRLDQIHVAKDQRKLKHKITSDAVELASKFEELLKTTKAAKEQLQATEKAESRPDSPRHQVTIEEVADESD